LTKSYVDDAALLLRERAGLKEGSPGRDRLQRLLEESATQAGMPVDSYVEMVDAKPEAFRDLLDRVTVQHSDFFRDPAQFDALAEVARQISVKGVTVWSAACGNGQEPYSIAMQLDECGRRDLSIIATDISSHALSRCTLARYSEAEVRGLSEDRRERYLVPIAGGYEIVPWLTRRVRFANHNLAHDDPPPVATCRVIFCRNVLMYFGREESEACVARLAAHLVPGGYLFIGHSDSPGRMSTWFEPINLAGAFLYRRLSPGPPPARAGRRATDVERDPDPEGLLEQGRSAAAGGHLRAAITAFRQATYLDPNLTIAFFQLGAALELAGDRREARRAFAAAGLALMRSEGSEDLSALEGYTGRDLARAIAFKLTALDR
jgi:chemotaxis methyl-accepting protein methylase